MIYFIMFIPINMTAKTKEFQIGLNMENQPNLSPQSINVDPNSPVNNNFPTISSATETPSLASNGASIAAHVSGNTLYRANNYPLFLAATKGDWESAKQVIDSDPNVVTKRIDVWGRNALMVAASECRSKFMENLLERMSAEEVAMQDNNGDTALHRYVKNGDSMKTVHALVTKNAYLTQMTNSDGHVPLHIACQRDNIKDLVWYLTLVTTDEEPSCPFTGQHAGLLACGLTSAGFHDITLYLVERYPNLVMATSANNMDMLSCLSLRFVDFPNRSENNMDIVSSLYLSHDRCLYRCITPELIQLPPEHIVKYATCHGNTRNLTNLPFSTQLTTYGQAFKWFRLLRRGSIEMIAPRLKKIRETKIRHQCAIALVKIVSERLSTLEFEEVMSYFNASDALSEAINNGLVEIITIFLQQFPELIWFCRVNGQSLLHYSISQRQEKIFNILKSMNACQEIANVCDPLTGNTILHETASVSSTVRLPVSGIVLQMQLEWQWFKEVEILLLPGNRIKKNFQGKVAQEIFSEQHKELVEKAEKWMKDASTSCMVVGILIATVLFAAAFTVPGGNINDKGIPIFLHENIFLLFVVSDAVGLLSSLFSVLMFLCILTDRYAEKNFLYLLPKNLLMGFTSLFCAIVSMMVNFGSALSIVLKKDGKFWSSMIPVLSFGEISFLLILILSRPLFMQLYKNTVGDYIFKTHKIF